MKFLRVYDLEVLMKEKLAIKILGGKVLPQRLGKKVKNLKKPSQELKDKNCNLKDPNIYIECLVLQEELKFTIN
jgi:hypothetical protein